MPRDADVVVVGAGFAGLAAALELHDAGLSVIVVEGRERVGGRVWSVEVEGGAIAELGGEWIMPGDQTVRAFARQLGLALADADVDYLRREPRGVGAVSLEDLDAFLAAADAHLASIDARGLSVQQALDAVPGDTRARAVLEARLRGTFATDLSRVAWRAGWHAGRLSAEPAVYQRVADGNQAIAIAAAARLPDVRLGRTVTALEQGAAGIAVEGDDVIRASAAVVSIPAGIAARIAFDPPLPGDLRTAFEELPMGVASKLAVPIGEEARPCAVQCANASFWFWVGRGGDGQVRPVVTSFAGSEGVQELLGTASGGPAAWVRRIGELAPELALAGPGLMKTWTSDELAGGSYSAWDARSLARASVFERMHGAVAFAGEHTAGDDAGTMEGALRSGVRAAAQIVDALGRG